MRVNSATLNRKLKSLHGQLQEVHAIRLHRAISWLKAAEEQEKSPDFRLVSLWIACNSLYAIDELTPEATQERERFGTLVDKLLRLDEEKRLYALIWNKFSGPIRLLIENKYVYSPFWEYHRGGNKNWEKGFRQSIIDANNALACQNVNYLMRIVLDRLYVLRNQIVHGGATYKSKINRAQVRDGANILMNLLPIMIEIIMLNPKQDWGKIFYPPIGE